MEDFSNAMDSATIMLLVFSVFAFFHFKIHLVVYHFIRIAING